MHLENIDSFYQSVVENTFDAVIVINLEGIIQFISPNITKVLGYRQENVINTSFFKYLHRQDRIEIVKLVKKDINSLKNPFEIKVWNNHRKVKYFYAKITDLPKNSYLNGFIINLSDTTLAYEVSLKYEQVLRFYKVIAQNFPEGLICVLDKSLNTIFLGGELIERLEIDLDKNLGKDICSVIGEKKTCPIIKEKCEEAFLGKRQSFEKDSESNNHFFLIHILPIYNRHGNIKHILFIAQDISQRKVSGKRLHQINLELQQKNEKLNKQKTILENINEELQVQRQNAEMILNKLNDTNQLLSSQNIELLQQEERLSKANQEMKEQQEQLRITKESLEIKNKALAESLIQVEKLNQKLQSTNKRLIEKEEKLAIANEVLVNQKLDMTKVLNELSDRNFELDQIVYRTSHDIRSPLTSVLGLVNLLKLEGVPDNLMEYVQRIEFSIKKLDKFVNSMLNFAKANRSNRVKENIDFDEIIDKILEDIKYLENFSQVKIIKNINQNNFIFKNDKLRVEVIFANIISNAVKYSNKNIDNSFLEVNINSTDKGTDIQFHDNGIGISKEYIDKVFDMFVRATDTKQGSGLGLYIVKQTIEKMNGNIKIDSELDKGTTFDIFIPS